MQTDNNATRFRDLHRAGQPLVLFNVWDAGTAQAAQAAGAVAVATGSWSVAAAQGYGDGQQIPLTQLLHIVARITQSTDLPVSVDFEGGYASDTEGLVRNTGALLETGIVGINFEDQVIGGTGLLAMDEQAARIKAIADTANQARHQLFINARTDLFLQTDADAHASVVDEAIARAAAYHAAGAHGLFVPGLGDAALIKRIVAGVGLPVNVMHSDALPSRERLAALGVARISYGPQPYRDAMAAFENAASNALRQ
ncbi:MAG: isocitrate lyase/phosphoenolpyruvate mutase family protein [Pseudomonadota bacterium]